MLESTCQYFASPPKIPAILKSVREPLFLHVRTPISNQRVVNRASKIPFLRVLRPNTPYVPLSSFSRQRHLRKVVFVEATEGEIIGSSSASKILHGLRYLHYMSRDALIVVIDCICKTTTRRCIELIKFIKFKLRGSFTGGKSLNFRWR